MNTEKYIKRKRMRNILIYIVICIAAFYTMLKGNSLSEIVQAFRKIKYVYMFPAIITALFFVSSEGMMMWYIFRILGHKADFTKCIAYSFIGFFYSSITPSASGGQPMQLLYMKKDGNSLADSTIVLLILALFYKMVLCFIGAGLLIFWRDNLYLYLGNYMKLYYLGLSLNVLLVTGLLLIMISPKTAKVIINKIEKLLVRVYILKKSKDRETKINQYINEYRAGMKFLTRYKLEMINILLVTFIQRICPYIVTCLVYLGFSLKGTELMTIICLQAAVYTAVDMMPLPGAQGITELMYKYVFAAVFNGTYLTASLLAVRGFNYYIILIISMVVTVCYSIYSKKKKI